MCPHLEYGIAACSPISTNSKINYEVGNWHLCAPLRRVTSATGPSFLTTATASCRPDYRIQDIHSILGVDPNLLCLPPTRRGHRGHPYKVLQGTSHSRRRGSAFSVRAVEYWNKLLASIVTAPSVKTFKEGLEKIWTKVFPGLPNWLKFRLPNSLTHPPFNYTPNINSHYLYTLPKSLFCLCGFFMPIFYHYKS